MMDAAPLPLSSASFVETASKICELGTWVVVRSGSVGLGSLNDSASSGEKVLFGCA